jgi:hypothetical protein
MGEVQPRNACHSCHEGRHAYQTENGGVKEEGGRREIASSPLTSG